MKQVLLFIGCFLAGLHAASQPVSIGRAPLGSGEPGQTGYENAQPVENNIYHAPQYLPGSPTSAMLWARVVPVRCVRTEGAAQCEGYHWSPAMGRAEYLYFTPVFVATPGPVAP